MKTKVFTVFICFVFETVKLEPVYVNNAVVKEIHQRDVAMDITDFSVYYDIRTNETIRRIMPRPWYRPGWGLRLPFTGGPCECENYKCTCCTGIRIQALGFDRSTCAIIQFEPEEATINLEVKMSNNSVLVQTFSASNPPPFCVPVPVPYIPPGLVDICIRLFDVSIIQQKLHVCMDMDTRIDTAPVLILHFDCMDMGIDGVSLSKPGGGTGPTNTVSNSESTSEAESIQVNSDVYDPVTEDPNYEAKSKSLFENSIKYI